MSVSIGLLKVSKRFGEQTVFCDLSMTFPSGRASCVMGPSGCGKTTLLRLLMGLETPDAGKAFCEGTVSAVFQENRLLESLTAPGNLRFILGRGKQEAINGILDELELGDTADKPVKTFSGGMKRRVAIARALIMEHDVLLLDEPFKGLDEELKARTAEIILRREAGKTVILVTHNPAEAQLLGAEVFRLP